MTIPKIEISTVGTETIRLVSDIKAFPFNLTFYPNQETECNLRLYSNGTYGGMTARELEEIMKDLPEASGETKILLWLILNQLKEQEK